MKIFPSAGGRRLWVRTDAAMDTTDADVLNAANQYVRRSRSVRLANSHKDSSGNRWFMFKVTKNL